MRHELIYSAYQQSIREIEEDFANGTLPADGIATFADLHNYVDANCYGGLCDDESPHHTLGFPEGGEPDMSEVNRLQDLVDEWLQARALLEETKPEPCSYLVGLPVAVSINLDGSVTLTVYTEEVGKGMREDDATVEQEAYVEAALLTGRAVISR